MSRSIEIPFEDPLVVTGGETVDLVAVALEHAIVKRIVFADASGDLFVHSFRFGPWTCEFEMSVRARTELALPAEDSDFPMSVAPNQPITLRVQNLTAVPVQFSAKVVATVPDKWDRDRDAIRRLVRTAYVREPQQGPSFSLYERGFCSSCPAPAFGLKDLPNRKAVERLLRIAEVD